jgi:hypothetical protein
MRWSFPSHRRRSELYRPGSARSHRPRWVPGLVLPGQDDEVGQRAARLRHEPGQARQRVPGRGPGFRRPTPDGRGVCSARPRRCRRRSRRPPPAPGPASTTWPSVRPRAPRRPAGTRRAARLSGRATRSARSAGSPPPGATRTTSSQLRSASRDRGSSPWAPESRCVSCASIRVCISCTHRMRSRSASRVGRMPAPRGSAVTESVASSGECGGAAVPARPGGVRRVARSAPGRRPRPSGPSRPEPLLRRRPRCPLRGARRPGTLSPVTAPATTTAARK